jgi:glycine C-acetyltransferase
VNARLDADLRAELDELERAGTYKHMPVLASPQGPEVLMEGRGRVIVLSSNNYLGLAGHPEVIAAGKAALDEFGAGTASVRFICGTFTAHIALEQELADFMGTEAALTYVSCWNANEAVIPSLVDANTVLLSDALNHASIIDAMRMARPLRKVIYPHSDMEALERELRACEPGTRRLIVTDGVFSMEGDLARLPDIVRLARAHDAIVLVDDSHGTGVLGETGRGTHEHFGLVGEIDVLTGTLGKALGGAAGGYVAASRAVCEILAQRSRPQLFSNALPVTVAASALAAVRVLRAHPELVTSLHEKTAGFRRRIAEIGYRPLPGDAAIIPIIVGDTARAIRASAALLDQGVFVTGFGFPVVPEGTARIRVQMTAAAQPEHLDRALAAFETVGRAEGLLES